MFIRESKVKFYRYTILYLFYRSFILKYILYQYYITYPILSIYDYSMITDYYIIY